MKIEDLRSKLLIVFAGFILVLLFVYPIPQKDDRQSFDNHGNEFSTEEYIKVAIDGIQIPLFPKDIDWGEKYTVNQSADYNLNGERVDGRVVYEVNDTNFFEAYSGLTGQFFTFYDGVMSALGWKHDSQFAADGPYGSAFGYAKNNKRSVFSYEFKLQPGGRCPCSLTFSILIGELIAT